MLKRLVLASALLCACAAPALASARHHHRHHWHHHRAHAVAQPEANWWAGQLGRRHVVDARAAGRPLELHPLLQVAQRFLGSGNPAGTRGPWCRDFVNLVAQRAGYRLANHSRRAIDALHLGRRVSDPRPGDLVVMKHHVTIFAGRQGGRVLGLGGNQGHRVKVSAYPRGRILAFVRL